LLKTLLCSLLSASALPLPTMVSLITHLVFLSSALLADAACTWSEPQTKDDVVAYVTCLADNCEDASKGFFDYVAGEKIATGSMGAMLKCDLFVGLVPEAKCDATAQTGLGQLNNLDSDFVLSDMLKDALGDYQLLNICTATCKTCAAASTYCDMCAGKTKKAATVEAGISGCVRASKLLPTDSKSEEDKCSSHYGGVSGTVTCGDLDGSFSKKTCEAAMKTACCNDPPTSAPEVSGAAGSTSGLMLKTMVGFALMSVFGRCSGV